MEIEYGPERLSERQKNRSEEMAAVAGDHGRKITVRQTDPRRGPGSDIQL